MKKIIFFVLGMLFLSSCGNSTDNSSNSVAVTPENRESFFDNPYFSSDDFKNSYDYGIFEGINRTYFENQSVEDYLKKKTQYNTFKEAIEKSYNWDKKVLKEILDNEKNVEYIKKIEKIAKSKFTLVKIGTSTSLIYFTAVTPNEFGESGKYNIIKVNFDRGINSVTNIDFPYF